MLGWDLHQEFTDRPRVNAQIVDRANNSPLQRTDRGEPLDGHCGGHAPPRRQRVCVRRKTSRARTYTVHCGGNLCVDGPVDDLPVRVLIGLAKFTTSKDIRRHFVTKRIEVRAICAGHSSLIHSDLLVFENNPPARATVAVRHERHSMGATTT